MKILYLIDFRFGLLCLISLLFSCKEENNKENVQNDIITEVVSEISAPSSSFILPSPLQIANIFKKSGLNYVSNITNPTSNVNLYSTNFSKAIGMGAYSSDIAYNIVNKKPQEALNYLKVIKQLATDLGMSNVFETGALLTRFENNVGNEDSLAYIIADLQIGFDSFLEDNEKEYLSVVIFSGAWVESMYIGSKSSQSIINERLYSKLGEQYNILNNLIKALKSHKESNSNIISLVEDFTLVKEDFQGFGFPSDENDLEETAYVLTEENVNKLTATLETIRTKFIIGTYQ